MYFDGENVIIGSLNLYDYSIINNREMGVLLKIYEFDNDGEKLETSKDFREEIKQIFNGSFFEQKIH